MQKRSAYFFRSYSQWIVQVADSFGAGTTTVEFVAENRATSFGKMHTQLVRSTRPRKKKDVGEVPEGFGRFPDGERIARISGS